MEHHIHFLWTHSKSYTVYGLSVYIMTFDLGWHWKVKSRSFGVHWAVYHTRCIIRQRCCQAERPLVHEHIVNHIRYMVFQFTSWHLTLGGIERSNQGHLVFIGLYIILSVLLDSGAVRPRGLLFFILMECCLNFLWIFSSAVPSGSGAFQMPTRPSSASLASTLRGGKGQSQKRFSNFFSF